MLVKKEIEYAVWGLLNLASSQVKYKKIKEIANDSGLPESFLSKIFQKLSKANLVNNKFGPQGGFALSKVPQEISLADIFQAVEDDFFVECTDFKEGICQKKNCPFRLVMKEAEKKLQVFFKRKKLSDLLKKYSGRKVFESE